MHWSSSPSRDLRVSRSCPKKWSTATIRSDPGSEWVGVGSSRIRREGTGSYTARMLAPPPPAAEFVIPPMSPAGHCPDRPPKGAGGIWLALLKLCLLRETSTHEAMVAGGAPGPEGHRALRGSPCRILPVERIRQWSYGQPDLPVCHREDRACSRSVANRLHIPALLELPEFGDLEGLQLGRLAASSGCIYDARPVEVRARAQVLPRHSASRSGPRP